MSKIPKAKAIELLQKAVNEIPKLKKRASNSSAFKRWARNTTNAIIYIFGEKSRHIKDFRPDFLFTPLQNFDDETGVLESMIEEIETYWDDETVSPPASNSIKNKHSVSDKIFIVHGRDKVKETVARFIEKQSSLEPILLQEQASQGRTIIEKIEEYSDVGFAIVLLTPDDIGGLKDAKPNSRARQNVIFELGYFMGKLGRKKVCALLKDDVEIPSDYKGIAYIPLDDAGAWKMELLKELKAAGYSIDTSKLI